MAAAAITQEWHTTRQGQGGRLELTRVSIPIRGLPAPFSGYRILHITDLHLCPNRSPAHVEQAVELAQRLAPDTIALTGDFISDYVDEAEIEGALCGLYAPDGVWGVMGNHDHWSGVEPLRVALSRTPVRELRNSHTRLEREGTAIVLAGVDDVWEGHAALPQALNGIDPDAPVILLAHEPDYADRAAASGRVSLQLSGHTHGGEVRIPGINFPVLSHILPHGRKYPAGLYRVGEMHLYTCRGIGQGWMPRIFCPPEVTEFTLIPG